MLKFTKDHEWLEIDGDVATVGITAYAAEQLGDLVFHLLELFVGDLVLLAGLVPLVEPDECPERAERDQHQRQ